MNQFIDLEKFKVGFIVIFISAALTAVGNTIQTMVKSNLQPVSFIDSFMGCMVIFGVAMVGYLVSLLPVLRKLSPVFWVGIIAVIMSIPGFPGSDFINKQSGLIQFAALGTPTLAYAGLALGKDLPMLKKLSWKIVIVGLSVIAGTFFLAAIVSQFMLKMEGII